VAVLELLATHPDQRFTLSEVARRCQLNKATAHALLNALSDRGVLLRHPQEKRYSLGPRLIAIGEAARHGYTAVDFAPAVLSSLAGNTGLWARAWRVVGEHVVAVASAGGPASRSASPARRPLVPPAGATFMAWSDGPSVEAWLARAGALEVVRLAVEAMPVIRGQRYSVTLSSPEWRALTGAEPESGAEADDPSVRRSLLAALGRQSLLAPSLDESRRYQPAEIESPVFDVDGRVELVISLTCAADRVMTGAELRRLALAVVGAADDLTTAVYGRRP
jgi:DNA-binding IclR family transcriptional regulator